MEKLLYFYLLTDKLKLNATEHDRLQFLMIIKIYSINIGHELFKSILYEKDEIILKIKRVF